MTTTTPWIRDIFGRAAGGVTRARLCRCPSALALLLAALALLAALPAAAQTTIWSGTLTVQPDGNGAGFGCSNDLYTNLANCEEDLNLTPVSFTVKGYTYTITELVIQPDRDALILGIKPRVPPDPLVLNVDGTELEVRSATRSFSDPEGGAIGTLSWIWQPVGISWSTNQQVSLSLVTAPENQGTTIWSNTLTVKHFFSIYRGCFGDDNAAYACPGAFAESRDFTVSGTSNSIVQFYFQKVTTAGVDMGMNFSVVFGSDIDFENQYAPLIFAVGDEIIPLQDSNTRTNTGLVFGLGGPRWVDFFNALAAGTAVSVRLYDPTRTPPPDDGPYLFGDEDDDDDGAPVACTLVAPYWSGPTGGFTVMPEPDRTSVSVTCGGRTREHEAEDGLVTRVVNGRCPGGLRVEGAAPGGWYWQHGKRNAAAAPFVCSASLGGRKAVVPGGVAATATDDATWFRHDTARLVGIVPHLEGNECSEYVSPYWQGNGGVVVRPAEGRSTVRVSVQCGATWSTLTASPGADGVAAELVRKDYCTDDEGEPRQGKLTVTGAAPGGWYWISGERNAAVAPLMCADLLGGPAVVDPGGVFSRATEDGTYFSHDADRLIGVVPHVAPARDQ